jgi:hypothetical protein
VRPWIPSQASAFTKITWLIISVHIKINIEIGLQKVPCVMKLRQLVAMATQWIPNHAAAGQNREQLQVRNITLGILQHVTTFPICPLRLFQEVLLSPTLSNWIEQFYILAAVTNFCSTILFDAGHCSRAV